jgi:hypothetical protein
MPVNVDVYHPHILLTLHCFLYIDSPFLFATSHLLSAPLEHFESDMDSHRSPFSNPLSSPILAKLAAKLKPPRPFWRIYVQDKNHPAKPPVVTMVGMDRTWSLAKGLTHTAPKAISGNDIARKMVEDEVAHKRISDGLHGGERSTAADLETIEPNHFDVSITCEFPVSESNRSAPVPYSTTLAPVFAAANGAEVIKLEMPRLHDPDGALAAAGIQASYRLEGLSAKDEWETIYRGNDVGDSRIFLPKRNYVL